MTQDTQINAIKSIFNNPLLKRLTTAELGVLYTAIDELVNDTIGESFEGEGDIKDDGPDFEDGINVSAKTQKLWFNLTQLNGGGSFDGMIDEPNESLDSYLDSAGLDVFLDALEDASRESQAGYEEEVRDAARGKGGSLSDLEADQEALSHALNEFLESLKLDYPENETDIDNCSLF